MKAIQVTFDEQLLAELDNSEEVTREDGPPYCAVPSRSTSGGDGDAPSQISTAKPMARKVVSARNTRVGRSRANGLSTESR